MNTSEIPTRILLVISVEVHREISAGTPPGIPTEIPYAILPGIPSHIPPETHSKTSLGSYPGIFPRDNY